jgi:NAD(P)-dependent dehydrogenase (short-subunit alcohol dehydrogenase family)
MHVVITGASRGIGAELAKRYRADGHTVTGTSRRGGGGLVALDVTRAESFEDLAAHLGGRAVDLVVCNAGIYPDKGQALDTGYPASMWAETFATNVTGVFLTVQALLTNLRAAQGARIAIISSQMQATRVRRAAAISTALPRRRRSISGATSPPTSLRRVSP